MDFIGILLRTFIHIINNLVWSNISMLNLLVFHKGFLSYRSWVNGIFLEHRITAVSFGS